MRRHLAAKPARSADAATTRAAARAADISRAVIPLAVTSRARGAMIVVRAMTVVRVANAAHKVTAARRANVVRKASALRRVNAVTTASGAVEAAVAVAKVVSSRAAAVAAPPVRVEAARAASASGR